MPPLRSLKALVFAVTLSASLLAAADDKSRTARYVRIELPKKQYLVLNEVEIFSAGKNIARSAKSSQSSVNLRKGKAQGPEYAIDGNASGDYKYGGFSAHTNKDAKPWWEIDLGKEVLIDKIKIWN